MPPCRFGKVCPRGDAARNVSESRLPKEKMRGGQELFRGLCTRNRPLALLEEALNNSTKCILHSVELCYTPAVDKKEETWQQH